MPRPAPPGWRPHPVRLRTPEFWIEGEVYTPPKAAGAPFLNRLGRYLTLEGGRVMSPKGEPLVGPRRLGVEKDRVLFLEGLPPAPWPLAEAMRERRRVAFFYADMELSGELDLRRGTELATYLSRTREFVDLFAAELAAFDGRPLLRAEHLVVNLDATLGVIEVQAGDFGTGL